MRRLQVRSPGASLVEALIAAIVLSLVAVSLYSALVSSLRTTGLDRAHEVRRQVIHDLLERFAHDSSDLASLWPAAPPSPYPPRTLTVDEALAAIGCSSAIAPTMKTSLAAGQVTGFTLVWTPGVQVGAGSSPARSVRLDRLYAATELGPWARGPGVLSFRLFLARSRP